MKNLLRCVNPGRCAVGAFQSVVFLVLTIAPTGAVITIEVEDDHDVEIVGKSFQAHMPYSMTKGDFNDDGFEDLVLGSFREHSADESVFNLGLVSVFFGGAGFKALPDQVQVGQLTGTPSEPVHEDVAIYGSGLDDSVGTLLAAGDLDNDGYDDLVVVAQDENPANAKPDRAKIGVFFGGPAFHGLLDFDAGLKRIRNNERQISHPPLFKRIHNVLSIWAAHLLHASMYGRDMSKNDAINHVKENCIEFFEKKHLEGHIKLDYAIKIIDHWAEINT